MSSGRVYKWVVDRTHPLGGRVEKAIVNLPDLETRPAQELSWRFVRIRNGGWVNVRDGTAGQIQAVPIENAQPDAQGNYLFEPGRGGGRIDKVAVAEPDFLWRYVQAAHFGEVNTYYHLHRIASYIAELLAQLGVPGLPQVTAVVNAHPAGTEHNGIRDGVKRWRGWVPFQGAHYRLPADHFHIDEPYPLSVSGEIHLGPGWQLLTAGALVEAAGDRYRANASHNAGIIYHEYGHHITRYTADFRLNSLRPVNQQDNRKTALDEGTCDYWAATMLDTPHIWAWHQRHDQHEIHPRSLASAKTMDDFDHRPKADPHDNGTIWGAALWDLRAALTPTGDGGARQADLLLLKTLLLLGQQSPPTPAKELRRMRASYSNALSALLRADEELNSGGNRQAILTCFAQRKIDPEESERVVIPVRQPSERAARPGALKRLPPEEIPHDNDLLSRAELESVMKPLGDDFSFIAVGDIMLGGRTTRRLANYGADYPFAAILPLLRRASIVLGNLEGPFARHAKRQERNFSYRVDPSLAGALSRAHVNVVTLANNHLVDCGRAGVVETLDALADAGIASVGAGRDIRQAHVPVIRQAAGLRIGILGYYWNRRCAAGEELPGSAMDAESLADDISALRPCVDRVVVTFHWGIPYQREPLPEDREKARRAIDCGADLVVGHHPHILQPFEIYRGRPIFYSVGNFAFGSGNSRAEGMALAVRFEKDCSVARIYPLYVKNRDPRINYQPKVLARAAARRILGHLAEISGPSGNRLDVESGVLRLSATPGEL